MREEGRGEKGEGIEAHRVAAGLAPRSFPYLIAIGLLLGCTQAPAPTEPSPAADVKQAGAADAAPVAVRVVDESELERAIQQHRGKVVLVDFWATWCLACKELFPHTVALHRRLADQGLAVISVSLDDPEREADVRAFLRAQGATLENFISRYGASSESTGAFAIKNDTLPYYRLYDRHGKLHQTFGGGAPVEADALDRAVEELLHQPSSPPEGR